jgi:2-polyprenyl-3-methyl-5-hydroxy-6-metoxy-1,4-benzoquinol methylase
MKVNLKIFNTIYKYNLWLFGSGSGSLAINNKPYINFLQNFIKEKSIKSIIDIGCGDWQLFEKINLSNTKYLGLDLVESVIEANKKKYGNSNVQFQYK